MHLARKPPTLRTSAICEVAIDRRRNVGGAFPANQEESESRDEELDPSLSVLGRAYFDSHGVAGAYRFHWEKPLAPGLTVTATAPLVPVFAER
jgi:hypothetical protein